jgi:hypothetical protein
MGDDFKRETGLDPRDPATVPQQAKWVAAKLKADPSIISQFHGYQGPANAASGAPSAAPSTGALPGAPSMTWEDLKNNPYASAAYATALGRDAETRARVGSSLLDTSTRSLQNGIPPSQENMTQIEQLATPPAMAASPALAEKYDAYSKEVAAYSLANQSMSPVGGGAGGQPLIDQARAAAVAQPDILQRQIVDRAQKLRNDAETLLKADPVTAALNYKAIGALPAPLDPAQPQTIPTHFAGNAAVVDAISAREPGFSKSVVFKNETDRFGAAMAGPAPVVNSILQSIYQLPQDKRDATLEMPEVKAAVLGAANSPDADKKQVAFSFMNQVYHDDPQSFKGKFGADGLKDLMGWQDVEQFKTRDQISKDANTAKDASTIRAQDAVGKEAEKLLKGVTPTDISNKLAPHWGQSFGLGGDYTPVSDTPAQTKAALLDDYSRAYTDHYSKYGDANAADSYATRATSDKWGPSDANGGRVMAYPPEKSPAYPQVDGSQDYIGAQLADFVAQAGHAGAESHLVPDKTTQDETDSGKPRGYNVIVRENDGQYHLLMKAPGIANFNAAIQAIGLTTQEQGLYRRHLANLTGPGGVDNPNGSRSTLFQMSFDQGGKTYNIPTVWDGKILAPKDAVARANAEGIDKSSYGGSDEAETRYQQMHGYMEKDTADLFQGRAGAVARFYADPGTPQAQAYAAVRAGLAADQGPSAMRPSLASGRWGGAPISEPVREAARSVASSIVEGASEAASAVAGVMPGF